MRTSFKKVVVKRGFFVFAQLRTVFFCESSSCLPYEARNFVISSEKQVSSEEEAIKCKDSAIMIQIKKLQIKWFAA